MKQGGGGLGFVMAIVVLVIVLFLAAKAWNAAMPKAVQAVVPGSSRVDDHGQTGAGDAVRSGTLPDMKQMGQNTDQHIQQIQDAAGKQD